MNTITLFGDSNTKRGVRFMSKNKDKEANKPNNSMPTKRTDHSEHQSTQTKNRKDK